jgi:hypothetical protein
MTNIMKTSQANSAPCGMAYGNLPDPQHPVFGTRLDVAKDMAEAMKELQAFSPAYYTQSPGRGLGGHVLSATRLYELTGDTVLEESARTVAMNMIGRDPQGQIDPNTRELAEYLVDPDPSPPGLFYGQGSPVDDHLAYNFPAGVAYAELTNDENMWEWIRTQVKFIRDNNVHLFPINHGNHWIGMAAAYHKDGDPTYLGVGAADFNRIKTFDRHDVPLGAYRAFPFFNFPYLMEALASAGPSSVQPIPMPDSTGGEVLINKPADPPGVPEPAYRVTIGARRTQYRTDLLNATQWCAGCKVYMRMYNSDGMIENEYPGLTQLSEVGTRSRTWYSGGGWIKTFNLPKNAGTSRIRIEIDNLNMDGLVEPLFQLFVLRTSGPGSVDVMVSGGNGDGVSPGYRYDPERTRWAFVPNAQTPGQPVQFTFMPFASNSRLLFNAYGASGQPPTLAGSGPLIGTGTTAIPVTVGMANREISIGRSISDRRSCSTTSATIVRQPLRRPEGGPRRVSRIARTPRKCAPS